MTNKSLTLIALVLAVLLIIGALVLADMIQLDFILFEDGSFRLTGCLPGQLCS